MSLPVQRVDVSSLRRELLVSFCHLLATRQVKPF